MGQFGAEQLNATEHRHDWHCRRNCSNNANQQYKMRRPAFALPVDRSPANFVAFPWALRRLPPLFYAVELNLGRVG